jgi:hypothetical protein
MLSREFHCRDCGGAEGYPARPRTVVEKYVLPRLLMRPVRCSTCFRRSWVPLFVHIRENNKHGASAQAA